MSVNNFKTTVLAFFASGIIRLLRWSWRVRVETMTPLPRDKCVVFCFWHGNQAGLFAYPHSQQVAVLSSLSADGTLQAKILRRLGFAVCRGSSSRGGATALKGIVKQLRANLDAAFAVDGPRGPYHQAKPGAIEAAKQSDALIVPIHAHANRVWVFRKSWDQYTLPKPFARVRIVVGAPMAPDNVTAAQLTTLINDLGPQLHH